MKVYIIQKEGVLLGVFTSYEAALKTIDNHANGQHYDMVFTSSKRTNRWLIIYQSIHREAVIYIITETTPQQNPMEW